MANRNQRRQKKEQSKVWAAERRAGWKIKPAERKRRSLWKGALGSRRPTLRAELR
jgi:hypothetical protein